MTINNEKEPVLIGMKKLSEQEKYEKFIESVKKIEASSEDLMKYNQGIIARGPQPSAAIEDMRNIMTKLFTVWGHINEADKILK
jgi:histidinol phosphatase-like enzyme